MYHKIKKLERGLRSKGSRPLERENVLEKFYVNIASPVSPPSAERKRLSTRRIFHKLERQYLSLEAQSVACSLLDAQSVPPDVTENAIQQAVVLGSMSGTAIDAQTFEALLEAVSLNPSFRIPFSVATPLTPFNSWVC